MTSTRDRLIAAVAQDGPRRHARWDAAHFQEVADRSGKEVWQAVQTEPQAESVFTAYLRLVEEALGAGYLRRSATDGAGTSWPNFLSYCLVHLVPVALPRVPERERLPLLAKVWNIGEGLLREPAWVDRYVTACAGSLSELTQLEDFLVRTLEPALAPAKPARWQGPFGLMLLDARQIDDEFLPGEMHLAAPAVVCVHDRRRPQVQLAAFLQHDGRSRFLGVQPCLGHYPEPEVLPAMKFTQHRLQVGTHAVDLPLLGRCLGHVLAGPGFAVVSEVDSQRLWVVETR